MKSCEHCGKRILSPWSWICTWGLWHNRCLREIMRPIPYGDHERATNERP